MQKNYQKVLKALVFHKYTFRTIEGIGEDAKLTSEEVASCLDEMRQERLTNKSKKRNGWRWYATAKGRSGISELTKTNGLSEPSIKKHGN